MRGRDGDKKRVKGEVVEVERGREEWWEGGREGEARGAGGTTGVETNIYESLKNSN